MAEVILRGECGGRAILVAVPEDWTGKVSIVLNVHKSAVSKRVQIIKEESHDLEQPSVWAPGSIGPGSIGKDPPARLPQVGPGPASILMGSRRP